MVHTHLHSLNIWFLLAVSVSLMNVGIGLFVVFEELFVDEMATGWLLSFLNHIAQGIVARLRRTRGASQFFILCLGLNALRIGVFFFLVVAVLFLTGFDTMSFTYSLISTYFIFLIYHVLHVHYFSLI